MDRLIGALHGDKPGPLLIAVAGIHGNEFAGVSAVRRVLSRLDGKDLCGDIVFFAGNLAGLAKRARYIDKDMNRVWTEDKVAKVLTDGPRDSEDREQLELLSAIREARGEARGPVYLIDLHTTSASGVPFLIFGDTLAQRNFVDHFPLPMIFGLEEQVDGVLSEYWTRQGFVTFTVEGGQHDADSSIDNLETVLLLATTTVGIANAGDVPDLQTLISKLEAVRGALPRRMEVVRRHAISEADSFKMEPGFRNLDQARAGQLIARDRKGDIRAPSDGLVLLPLYQGLGSDGFFWGRAVSELQVAASEVLRTLHVDRFLDWLPGIERDRKNPNRLLLDSSLARLYPHDLFHVLGYRRIRHDGQRIVAERQPE